MTAESSRNAAAIPQSGDAARILYISYDGLLEPLGESQVLQYLKGLSKRHVIVLITFEKEGDWARTDRRSAIAAETKAAGITWVPLRYHKRPAVIGTALDIVSGLYNSCLLSMKHDLRIVHARSYVAAIIGLVLKVCFGKKFIFDMRGFWPDERVNAGQLEIGSSLYRIIKWFEKMFLLKADATVSLTEAAVKAIRQFPFMAGRDACIEVIPTCVNLDRFAPSRDAERQGLRSPFTLGFTGSVTGWCAFDAILQTFSVLHKFVPESRLLVLNRDAHSYVRLRAAEMGIPEETIEIRAAEFAEVHRHMAEMDAGILLYRNGFSELARCPTKLAEFLGCGIPVVANAGIGDVEAVVAGEQVGVVLQDLGPEQQEAAVKRLLVLVQDVAVKERCSEVAQRLFSLNRGVAAYDRIYRSLAGNGI